MYEAIICTVTTGRVRRRRFLNRDAADKWVRRIEDTARRFRLGLRGIRIEVGRVAA